MLLTEFVPDIYKTHGAQAALRRLTTRAQETGAKEDLAQLADAVSTLLTATAAKLHATPHEEVDKIFRRHLADWYEDFGRAYDDMMARQGDDIDAPPSWDIEDVLLNDDLVSNPVPGVFMIEGLPFVLSGDRLTNDALNGFRSMARDAWKARQGSTADSADKT